jgi:hypothetical protein
MHDAMSGSIKETGRVGFMASILIQARQTSNLNQNLP